MQFLLMPKSRYTTFQSRLSNDLIYYCFPEEKKHGIALIINCFNVAKKQEIFLSPLYFGQFIACPALLGNPMLLKKTCVGMFFFESTRACINNTLYDCC